MATTVGLAALAAGLALAPRPALAQFDATGTVTAGSASGLQTDRIIVNTPYTEINWTPIQGNTAGAPAGSDTIFLPQGRTVTYWDGARTGNYIVLNRVLPADPTSRVVFNGTVNSLVGTERGGTVWFYSPAGILVGSTAVFNVGNLLLSTGAISCAAGNCETVLIDSPAQSRSRITVDQNARIASSGYTALVAPRIDQNGLIRSGGPAALVAGEDVTLTIRADLFDIAINIGAYSDPADPNDNVMIQQGETGETLSNSLQGPGLHRVYIAGLAQLDPMSILLGGTVQVRDATVTSNGVVLSAGGNIVNGQAVIPAGAGAPVDLVIDAAPPTHSPDPPGDIYPHTSSSNFVARATGSIALLDGAALRSGEGITLDADLDILSSARTINAGGPLAIRAGRDLFFGGATQVQANTLTARAGDDLVVNNDVVLTAGQGGMILAANDATARGPLSFGPNNVATLLAAGTLTSAGAMQLSGEAVGIVNARAASITVATNANVAGTTDSGGSATVSACPLGGCVVLANVAATGTLDVTAAGLAQVQGLSSGQTVTINAQDIAVTPAGRLSQTGVGAMTLTASRDVTSAGIIDAVGVLGVTAGRDVFFSGGTLDAGTLNLRAGDDIFSTPNVTARARQGGMVLAANDAAAAGSQNFVPNNNAELNWLGILTSEGPVRLSGEAVIVSRVSGSSITIATNAPRASGSASPGFENAMDCSSGVVCLGEASTPGALTITSRSFTAFFDPVTGSPTANVSASDILVNASDIALAENGRLTQTGTGAITLNASRDVTSSGRINAAGALGITAGRDVFLDTGLVQGASLSVRAGDDIGIASGVAVTAGAGGMILAANDATARGQQSFGPGNVAAMFSAGNLASGGTMQLSGEAVEVQNATASAITISTNANVAGTADRSREPILSPGCVFGAACLGNVAATGALTVTAGGLAQVSGIATGQTTVAITSADIAIGANGRIGNGSQSVTLTPVTTAGVFVGDVPGTGGYRLDAAEASRLQANLVRITPATANVTIGTLTLQGSQATGNNRPVLLGNQGTFRIQTGGSILVNGAVQVLNAGDANRLELIAQQRLNQVIPSGSITVRNSAGGLGGVLLMRARNILVADSAIQQQAALQPLFAGRDAALATNSGNLAVEGYVSAAQFIGEASESLHVQNTSTGTLFGGVQAQSLTINATGGTTPTDLILYGRRVGTTSTSPTDPNFGSSGLIADFRLREVTARSGSFTPGSSINGCLLTAETCLSQQIAVGLPRLDTINAVVGSEEQGNAIARAPLIPPAPLINASEFQVTDPVIIDEPVTGAGNPDTWQVKPECPEEDRERCR